MLSALGNINGGGRVGSKLKFTEDTRVGTAAAPFACTHPQFAIPPFKELYPAPNSA